MRRTESQYQGRTETQKVKTKEIKKKDNNL
jgi:hypothetical protein